MGETETLIATYTYDANGNRTSLIYANGTTTTYAYNKANLVTSVLNKKGATTLSSHSYTYYLDGNLASETTDGVTTVYTYDGLGRLTTETKNGIITTYTYDANGNRATMSQNGATTTYTYDANNRLLAETTTGIPTIYTYDANGNTIGIMKGGDPAGAYAYSLFGNQMSYTPNGVLYIYYTYRPDGLRHSIGDKVHVWDGANIVADVDGNDISVYIRGINLIYADDGDKTYYHFNAHGDVVVLTNVNGNKTKSYSYSAFGVEYAPSDLDDNPFRYCGEYFDKETQTIYLRARYYNAEQGRFTQQDGWEYVSLSELLSLNLYIYCFNNPVNRIDPCGNFSWKTMFAVGVTIAIVGIALLTAIPTGGGSLVLAGGGITAATATTAANAVVATGLAITSASLVAGGIEESGLNFKTSKQSDKERSTDKPSWVNKGHVDYNQTALENVTRIMNEKFGPGNWTKSTADGAFSKIFKWLTRHIGLK